MTFIPCSVIPSLALNYNTCIVSVTALKGNTHIPNVEYQIKDSSGQLLKFNSLYDVYSLAENGGGSSVIASDNYGEVEIDLPAGAYYICPLPSGKYTAEEESTYFVISDAISSKNINVFFEESSIPLFLSFESSSGDPITNCSFSLYDENMKVLNFFSVNGEYTLVDSGKTVISSTGDATVIAGLPEGSYFLSFNSLPNGMSIPQDSFPITLSKGNNDTTIKLADLVGDIVLTIKDSEGNAVKGSIISVVGTDSNILNFSQKSEMEYYYDPSGSFSTINVTTTEPILISGLPVNVEYTINETSPSSGFLTAQPVKVVVQSGDPSVVNIDAIKSTGMLSINVTDEVTGEPVEGATYSIVDSETNSPVFFSLKSTDVNNSAYVYDENGSLSAVTTGNIGIINIENMPARNYTIKAKETPAGYIIDSNTVEKTITANLTTVCDIILSKSNVAIAVYDENETPIMDVAVEIYDNSGTAILSSRTNAKGKILLTNVVSGTYTFRISSVPDGYSFDQGVQSFTIKPDGLADNLNPITLKKTTIKASIDAVSGKSMDNAVFALYDDQGKEILRALTNSSGIATFSGVNKGSYTIKQISAPVGYTVSDKVISVVIDDSYLNDSVFSFGSEENSTLSLSAEETKEKESSETRSSGGIDWGSVFWKALIILVGLGVVISIISVVMDVLEKKKTSLNKATISPSSEGVKGEKPSSVTFFSHESSNKGITKEVPQTGQKSPEGKSSVDNIDISAIPKEELLLLQKKLQDAIQAEEDANIKTNTFTKKGNDSNA